MKRTRQIIQCRVTVILWQTTKIKTMPQMRGVQNQQEYPIILTKRTIMAGAASKAGDADSSRAPGLTSGLRGSVIVHHGALLFVPQ